MSGGWGMMLHGKKTTREFFRIFFPRRSVRVEMGSCELLEKILSFSAFDVEKGLNSFFLKKNI